MTPARTAATMRACRLRPATAQDAALLWEWANDPEVRRRSFSPEPIAWESHQRWYAAKLTDAHTLIAILEAGDGYPLGQIRFEREPEHIEIDVTVAPGWRGQGIGRELLKRGLEAAARRWRAGTRLIAKVLPSNTASLRLFEDAGFVARGLRMAHDVSYYYFERAL